MKTFIWVEKNRTKTKFGYKFDVHVYKVVNNLPTFIGCKQDINSGSTKGQASEALSVLIDKGLIPDEYIKKSNGYYYETYLDKHKIRFIEV